MNEQSSEISCEVEVGQGQSLTLPAALLRSVGPGRWTVTIKPAGTHCSTSSLRDHGAFLRSYGPEDEGLYDDAPSG